MHICHCCKPFKKMKIGSQIIILLFINVTIYSQSKHLSFLTIDKKSNWNIVVDTISKSKFDTAKMLTNNKDNKTDWDFVLKSKATAYPESIQLNDSCCILTGLDKTIRLCKKRPENDRKWSNFSLYDVTNDYLIFIESGYEWWDFIAFNPLTKEYFFTQHIPIFINENIIYSYGNYYAEGQFQIFDRKYKKYYGFDTFNWELSKLYIEDSVFYIELTSNKSFKEKKYLKLMY